MKMDFNLELKQEQKLIMTQQMQLSVKLLEMSNIDIQTYVEKEIQENPIIDVDYNSKDCEKINYEIDYKKFLKHLDGYEYGNREYSKDKEYISPLNFIGSKKSLKEFLKDQILGLNDKKLKTVCTYIIENIDSRGYLNIDINDIQKELGVSKEVLKEALKIVQSLEPFGIGARDLKECLKIQLSMKKINDKKLILIIDNYLKLIANNKYNIIAKNLNISVKQAQNYGDIIKTLEPKPSRGFFTGEEVNFIVPEAYIKKINDKYYIIMNSSSIPKLNINNLYKNMLNNKEDKEVKEFIKGKLDSAVFLIKSINQRESTIYKILEKILEIQKDYFDYGRKSLKPMTLKDIAKLLEMHESTISRAIRDKYINTDRGTIRIKDLFTTKISRNDSFEEMSVNVIKNNIKEFIDSEDRKKPLSDQKICDLLKESGVEISRRTVAKYREELNILSSSKRKRF
ncbi:RNA polymerase subunit sigma-54 [Clostridium botulinum]|uniref:RNA polymerase sigma54 factor n=2 Tax=Clostridium botulinum TaxID=1491 RepID=A0A0A0IEE3_CLOBO|nr:RNA polymerase sigma54 factor [Clostridium botulinum C/D str. BKT75002]KEI09542.1 RNA polymerase sigma54 factor [Clostridium botulinum C/D str. BKT2873]KGM93436.1 RNA polymerase sigma54 factor [Clostridium botulinum D str. CCUG 7971]KGM98878.1 RNA polymerase sigma54 factor [Clostridium botulinum C/D str. DC5]KOC46912.1 RNA polymerase subunit sigma-54 [Clostridium botulinum]MCD3233841.1 RNA polymerase factor sigma-54 [Clostridium botulinum D/C]